MLSSVFHWQCALPDGKLSSSMCIGWIKNSFLFSGAIFRFWSRQSRTWDFFQCLLCISLCFTRSQTHTSPTCHFCWYVCMWQRPGKAFPKLLTCCYHSDSQRLLNQFLFTSLAADASSKSTPGATKPRTGSDAGIAAATDFTQNDASRIQMVEGAEGDAEIKPEATYVLKRDEFDDVEQVRLKRGTNFQLTAYRIHKTHLQKLYGT